MKKALLLLILISVRPTLVLAQNQKLPEGIWEGYDGEWLHVSQQLGLSPLPKPPQRGNSPGVPRQTCAPPARCTCTSPSPIFTCSV